MDMSIFNPNDEGNHMISCPTGTLWRAKEGSVNNDTYLPWAPGQVGSPASGLSSDVASPECPLTLSEVSAPPPVVLWPHTALCLCPV